MQQAPREMHLWMSRSVMPLHRQIYMEATLDVSGSSDANNYHSNARKNARRKVNFTFGFALTNQPTTFFIAFSLLEDCGYFARLSVLANRLFALIGLNGRAVLPMVLGLGCVTMAQLGERIDPVQRERLLAYGVSPGNILTLLRQRPMTVVLADEVELALESAVAREIWVQPC